MWAEWRYGSHLHFHTNGTVIFNYTSLNPCYLLGYVCGRVIGITKGRVRSILSWSCRACAEEYRSTEYSDGLVNIALTCYIHVPISSSIGNRCRILDAPNKGSTSYSKAVIVVEVRPSVTLSRFRHLLKEIVVGALIYSFIICMKKTT